MKLNRLVDKLGKLLSADRRKQEAKKKKLKELLVELKEQQRALAKALAEAGDPDTRAELELKLNTLTEQRRKGVALRKKLLGKD